MPSKTILVICDDAEELAHQAADRICKAAQAALAHHNQFSLVLVGGSTPEKAYKLLATWPAYTPEMWAKTLIFIGDERVVPYTDENSNYGKAKAAFLDAVPVTPGNVFPVDTSLEPERAAHEYEAAIGAALRTTDGIPRFDLVLMGVGDDGHTASLFPGMPSLDVHNRWVVASPPGTLPPPIDRVTLTYPILNQARAIFFLLSGEKKAAVLHRVLETNPDFHDAPVAGVRLNDGIVTYLVDKAAASQLVNSEMYSDMDTGQPSGQPIQQAEASAQTAH